jgi:signal transduction histidine kinase/ActR/RegA family two-component response regulator
MSPTSPIPSSAAPRAGLLFALLEQSHDLMVVTDSEGLVMWANARFRNSTAADPALRTALASFVFPGPQAEPTRKAIAQGLQGHSLVDIELQFRSLTGAPLTLRCNASPEMGQVVWALREVNAAAASAPLEQLDQARIAVWRHELKSDRVTFDAHAGAILPPLVGLQSLSAEEFRSHIHTDDLPRMMLSAEQALKSSHPIDTEARFRRADGGWRYVLTRRIVERAADGAPLAHVGFSMDVSEQVAHSHRTTGQAHRLDAAAQAAGVGIWSVTVGSIEADWNAQMYELFDRVGASRTPSLAEWIDQCVHVQDRQRVWRDVRAYFRAGSGAFEIEFRALRRDGSHRWMVLRAAVDASSTDRRRLFGIVMDITEQHNALVALRGADERAALAARLAGIGTWVLDLAPVVERWDEQMFHLRGLEPRDTPPTREERLSLLHPDDAHVVLDSQQAALNTDDATNYEFRVQIPGGDYRWLASRSIPVRDERGRTVRRVGVNWDITENKSAEVTRQQKVLAERENKAKSQFLSRMSHELRTPLNAVLGFTQLLQREAGSRLDEDQAARLGHIRSAGEHLLALINDMLDITSLEAGRLKLELQPVGLASLLTQAQALVEPLAAQHQVTLNIGVVDGHAQADPTRLRQVLINLLSNAIKYNRPHGSVDVSARLTEARVTLLVQDTGRGLNPEQLSHLFEPFNRLGIESEGIEGAGIGLVIVKGLTQAMGGTISVSSAPGEGTQFQLVLPAAEPLETPAESGTVGAGSVQPIAVLSAAADARTGQILYIEDNEVNVLLVEQLVGSLEGLGIACEPDGARGVERARQLKPDLILVDMQLPDFDGFEVLRRLRDQNETAHTPCIALSANAMPEDISRAIGVGFRAYWTKPINLKNFVTSMRELFPLAVETQDSALRRTSEGSH